MLGNKDKAVFGESGSTSLISRDTQFTGDIKFKGNLDIEGVVHGRIMAESGDNAAVRIVDEGVVEGEIFSPTVIVNGVVRGNVYASRHLEMASKARIEGDVQYARAEMAAGAEINGTMKHCEDVSKADVGKWVSKQVKQVKQVKHAPPPDAGAAPASAKT